MSAALQGPAASQPAPASPFASSPRIAHRCGASPSSSPCARLRLFFSPATVEGVQHPWPLSPGSRRPRWHGSCRRPRHRFGSSSQSIWLANSDAVRWRNVTPGSRRSSRNPRLHRRGGHRQVRRWLAGTLSFAWGGFAVLADVNAIETEVADMARPRNCRSRRRSLPIDTGGAYTNRVLHSSCLIG